MYFLGNFKDNTKAYWSDQGLNRHIVAFGCSGSGKTTCLMNLILQKAKQGEKVVVFNYKECLRGMPTSMKSHYKEMAKIYEVGKEGLPISLFKSMNGDDGVNETIDMKIDRLAAMFKNSAHLSMLQENLLRQALEEILERGELTPNEAMDGIADFLSYEGKRDGMNALGKIRVFVKPNLFTDGDFFCNDKPITEINLNALDEDDQSKLMRFLLDYTYRRALKGDFVKDGLAIYLDESQNLEFDDSAPLYRIINEGRKHGISLMMATPGLSNSKNRNMDIVTQFGTILFFKPLDSESRKYAAFIDAKNINKWSYKLGNLDKGYFWAKGCVEIGGELTREPKKLTLDLVSTNPSRIILTCGKKTT